MANKYLITACIVHYRKLPQLKKTIQALEQNTSQPLLIKILNQGYEGGGIRQYLGKIKNQENIEVIFNQKNIGCAAGRQLLTQNIATPYILMLDDDMYVSRHWDREPINFLQRQKNIAAVGFFLFSPDKKNWLAGGQNIEIKNNKVVKLKKIYLKPAKQREKFLIVDDVSAGAMLYKAELSQLIRWDPYYFIGFEDLDKGIQLKQSPYRCAIYLPSAFIHDKVSQNFSEKKYNLSRRDYRQYRRGYLWWQKKYGYRLTISRHLFYKYFCLLPPALVKNLALSWLKAKDWLIRARQFKYKN